MTRWRGVFAGAGVSAGLACATAPSPNAESIAIEIRRGPIAPVEQPGVDNTAAVAGARITISTDRRTIAGGRTDAAGRLTLLLDPGEYVADVTACPGALALPPALSFTVPLATPLLRLECDTGIR